MKSRLSTIALGTLTLLGGHTAFAQGIPELKFSGFGTVGVAHSNDRNSDFVGDIFAPYGVGYTNSTATYTDSRLGGQVAARFSDEWSAVVQLVSKLQYDGSYTPQLEWANVKYQVNSDLSVRLGRIALPTYALSESRFVGYASPWVRAPQEVYAVVSLTRGDGIDMTYRHQIGAANNAIQAYWGTSTSELSSGTVKSKSLWGVNDTLEFGSMSLRASYSQMRIDAEIPLLDPLFAGLAQFAAGAASVPVPAFQTAGAQARGLIEKYKLRDMNVKILALGATYDPGAWYVATEAIAFKGAGLLSDSNSYYVTAGYRFGSVTPYAMYSSVKAKIKAEAGISTVGAAPLANGAAGLTAGINATLNSFTPTQHTSSVGLRWDFASNLAAKFQVDRLSTGENSRGRLRTIPGLVAARNVNVVSAALDFVF